MKQDKPQWLIDAEAEITNFEKSKYGSMSQTEFNYDQRQITASHSHWKNNRDSALDHLRKVSTSESCSKGGHSAKLVGAQSKGGKINGPIQGRKNVESGQLEKARQKSLEKIPCQYCNKMIDRKNHKRWHGDRCKLKP
jgi:hypothetical protein